MYNWVTTRKIARTEGPTYPTRAAQTVDAVIAKWIPATAALLSCFVTPARATLDSRYYESPNYPVRAAQTVDATVRTWIPTFDNELAQTRTGDRPTLDVRRYEWSPEFVSIPRLVDPTIAKWEPAFDNEHAQFVTGARPPLDVRKYDWDPPESGWISASLATAPTVAQTWPAFQQSALSARTPNGPWLDVRQYDWLQSTTWLPGTFAPIASSFWVAPGYAQQQHGVTRARGTLDVRQYDWLADESSWIRATQNPAPTVAQTSPAWTNQDDNFRTLPDPTPWDLFRAQSSPSLFGVPDDWITWVPVQDDGGLTRDRARLDVRAYEWSQPAWIFTSLPTTFATVPQQVAVWADRGGRILSRPALDVRAYDWSPELDWIFAQLPAVPDATVAQQAAIWPTALTFSTLARGGDVRNVDTQPAFTWVQPVVDAAIAKLAPIFRAELASFRSPDDPRLDLRTYAWAPDAAAWELVNFAPPATTAQIWPALLQNLGTQYQTPARAPLDVRRYDWQPEFTWAARVVAATVAKWIPVFDAEVSYRTVAARALDVRSISDQPEISWLLPTLPPNVPLTTAIHLTGSYRPIISLDGSYWQIIALIGSVEPT
jgi:hypothetical protein